MDFNFEIEKDLGVIDEMNNRFIAVREVSWYGKPSKLEIRRWNVDSNGREMPDKGFTFMTEEGPHNLTEILVREGYGDTKVLKEYIDNRSPEEGRPQKETNIDISEEDDSTEDDYYDASMIIA